MKMYGCVSLVIVFERKEILLKITFFLVGMPTAYDYQCQELS